MYYIANFLDRTYCLGKRLLYSQLSGDRQLYSHLLKYYHTVNCLGERLLYSLFKGEILLYSQLSVIGLLFNNCLGERLLYSQLSGG